MKQQSVKSGNRPVSKVAEYARCEPVMGNKQSKVMGYTF